MQKIKIIVCSVLEMTRLLLKPQEAREMSWVRRLCQVSRDIHVAVWCRRLSHGYVRKVVLKCLMDSVCEILEAVESDNTGLDTEEVAIYIRNILKRALNIQNNYLQNRRTEFLPDDMLLNRSDYIWTKVDDADAVLSRIGNVIAA